MVAAGQIVRTSDVRRLIGWEVIDANSADIGTTETVVVTMSSVTVENGRAFEIELDSLISCSSTTARARIQMRKSTAAGTAFISWFDFTVGAANANKGISLRRKMVNTSGSDVTTDLVITLDEQSGAGTCRLAANTTNAAGHFAVYDIGTADDYPGIMTFS